MASQEYAIINGRRVAMPRQGLSGSEIHNIATNGRQGRRTVIVNGLNTETVDRNRRYTRSQLINKKGKEIQFKDMPDRTKGTSFWGRRSPISKQIITEQVFEIAARFFKRGVSFDEEEANWVVINHYVLPPQWHSICKYTELAVVFPTEYPQLPPIGFYLKADIPNAPNGHFYSEAYHDADKEMLKYGWKWYCVYVKPGTWQPSKYRKPGDWRNGDNLWSYFTLIGEALTSSE